MEYMHAHMQQSPELLNTCLSLLPGGVFSESTTGAPTSTRNARVDKTNKRNPRKNKNAGAESSSAADCLESITSKNNIIEQKNCLEMKSQLREELREEKKNKKVAFAELEERFHTKDAAKRNIKRFKDADVDDEDSDGEPYTESQQELLGDYVEVEESIADAQLQLESIQKKAKTYL